MLKIDEIPAGFFLGGFGVEILAIFFELGRVRVGGGGDFCDTGDARWLGVGVIEKGEVTDFHVAPHEVARLVIPDAGPRFLIDLFKVFDGEDVGFGFDQPRHEY